MTPKASLLKKFCPLLSLGPLLFPLSLASCSSRQIYFTNPPESATTFFDKNFSSDLVLQNRLINQQVDKLKKDLELMGIAFSSFPKILEEAFKQLEEAFKTLGAPIETLKKELSIFAFSFWDGTKLNFSSNNIEGLKRVERVFELSLGLLDPKQTQSRESLIESLKTQVSRAKTELHATLNELFLNLRPIEREWNALVEEHSFEKKDGSLKHLPLQKVFFQNVFDNVNLENIELLFGNLYLWSFFNTGIFFNYPSLSRDDFFELFRRVAPIALTNLPNIKSFGLFLKLLIILKATYVLSIHQSLTSLEAILTLSQKTSKSNFEKFDKAFKDIEKLFQQRKFFTNINTSFFEIKNNFEVFEKNSLDFQNQIVPLTKSLTLLGAEVGSYHVNLPKDFFENPQDSKNVLSYTLEVARDINVTQIPQVIEGYRTLSLSEFFNLTEKNLKEVNKYLTSPTQKGKLANHLIQLEEEMGWFFNLSFSNLHEGVLLLTKFREIESKFFRLFNSSIEDFINFEVALARLLYNLLLFNIVLQKLNFIDKSLKNLEDNLKFLKDFFEKTLYATLFSYSKNIRGLSLESDSSQEDQQIEINQTQKLIQKIREMEKQSNIFLWIHNFKGSYFGAYSILEYLLVRLYETL